MGWVVLVMSAVQITLATLCLLLGHLNTGAWGFTLLFNVCGLVILFYALRWPFLYHHFLLDAFRIKAIGALGAARADDDIAVDDVTNRSQGCQCCNPVWAVATRVRVWWRSLVGVKGRYFAPVTAVSEVIELCIQTFNLLDVAPTIDS